LLPGTDDKAREEFLEDVCAFANASGGDLVYGLQEKQGHVDCIVPVPIVSSPVDATKRR
jgi:predicted HTH transcriptional regulator